MCGCGWMNEAGELIPHVKGVAGCRMSPDTLRDLGESQVEAFLDDDGSGYLHEKPSLQERIDELEDTVADLEKRRDKALRLLQDYIRDAPEGWERRQPIKQAVEVLAGYADP